MWILECVYVYTCVNVCRCVHDYVRACTSVLYERAYVRAYVFVHACACFCVCFVCRYECIVCPCVCGWMYTHVRVTLSLCLCEYIQIFMCARNYFCTHTQQHIIDTHIYMCICFTYLILSKKITSLRGSRTYYIFFVHIIYVFGKYNLPAWCSQK